MCLASMTFPERRKPSLARDRFSMLPAKFDDFAEGVIAFGMSKQLPADASADFVAGYREAREQIVSVLSAVSP